MSEVAHENELKKVKTIYRFRIKWGKYKRSIVNKTAFIHH
jgi:hypothetical protein